MELVGYTPRKTNTNITKKALQRNMVKKKYLTSNPYFGPEENRAEAKTITHKDRELISNCYRPNLPSKDTYV